MLKRIIELKKRSSKFITIIKKNNRYKEFYKTFSQGRESLIKIEKGDETHFFKGIEGEERLVKKEYSNGNKVIYEGAKGKEYYVRAELANGNKFYFDGKKDTEKLVKIEQTDGKILIFDIVENNMVLSQIIQPCGYKIIY